MLDNAPWSILPGGRRPQFVASSRFAPTDITSWVQRVDATDATKVTTDPSGIVSIADLVSGGAGMTAINGTPSWDVAAVNGLNAAGFLPNNDLVGTLALPSVFTLFAVFKPTTVSAGGGDRLFGGEEGTGHDGLALLCNLSGGQALLVARKAGTNADVSINLSLMNNASPAWVVFACSVGPSGVRTWVNGTPAGSNTIITSVGSSGHPFVIGRSSDSNANFWTGEYAEHDLANAELTGAEISNMTTWLRAKYAI